MELKKYIIAEEIKVYLSRDLTDLIDRYSQTMGNQSEGPLEGDAEALLLILELSRLEEIVLMYFQGLKQTVAEFNRQTKKEKNIKKKPKNEEDPAFSQFSPNY